MTYKELNDRLSKCESALEKIKNGNYTPDKNSNLKETTKRLTLLRESLQKQIAESEETMFVSTKGGETKAVQMDRKNAMDLKKDPNITSIDTAKGQSIKEDIKFSVEETKAIAKKVGQAVAIALKESGDEIGTMKAKRIEPNSFEIYVEYKKDIATDEFSFYITDDTLHLTDFSFDKELTDVGVKPSGEAILNVDVLANELKKHFASMEEMKNPGYSSSSQRNQYAQRGGVKLSKKGKEDLNKRMKDFSQRLKDKGIAEAPDNMYYIKIPKDAASQNKAQVIFNDLHDINYELNDDPDGIFMYFKKEDFDAGVIDDLEGDGVHILDTNIPNVNEDAEEDAKNDADYEAGWHDDPRKDEDVDVGHQDDEPDMLQSTAYETAQYAAKLVKKLQKYDQFDGEVDFPNWWQSKLILAKDYMQKAYHYLDSEEKQPAIDQLALEEKVNERLRFLSPEKQKANDAKFEKRMALLKALEKGIELHKAGKISDEDLHNLKLKAGTISADSKFKKENVNERLSGDAREAIYDLQNILDQAAQLGDEARQIVKQHFPNELSAGDAYDVFSFGTSSNSYDKTLETLISDIERTAEEEDMDMDEGVAKTKKAHDLVVNKMKQLAKQYKSGDTSVISQLKDLTAKKKQLIKQLEKDVAGKNKGQELAEYRGVENDIKNIIRDKAADSGFDEQEEAMEVMEFIGQEYDIDFEFGAGPSRQESINEQATCCGKCGRVHVKGTKCKRPYLKGKDHCRNN